MNSIFQKLIVEDGSSIGQWLDQSRIWTLTSILAVFGVKGIFLRWKGKLLGFLALSEIWETEWYNLSLVIPNFL